MFTAATESLYEERQSFAAFFYVVTLIPVVIVGVILATSHQTPLKPEILLLILVGIFFFEAFLLNLSILTTRITQDHVEISLGRWIPFFRKRIPLATLRSFKAVTYRPLLDAGGWGIRMGRFEGTKCWFYNTRGKEGVLIETDTQRCIIGSQMPDQLVDVIKRTRSENFS